MDRNKKMQLLQDMQEHPEDYTEQALLALWDDPEARELMEATAQLKQAMISNAVKTDNDDIDAEWQRFAQTHLAAKEPGRRWLNILHRTKRLPHPRLFGTSRMSESRSAAMFIGILMVSGIALAAIHIVRQNVGNEVAMPATAQEKGTADSHRLPADTISPDSTSRRVIRFEEATLQQILTEMTDYYGLTIAWRNEDVKSLRLFLQWNQQATAEEAVRQLNSFQRFRLELSDTLLIVE